MPPSTRASVVGQSRPPSKSSPGARPGDDDGRLLAPSDQDDPPAGLSQADVLDLFSRPEEEIRRDVTDRLTPQSLLMDPEFLQITVQDGIIEAVRYTGAVVIAAVRDQRDPADDRLHTATS